MADGPNELGFGELNDAWPAFRESMLDGLVNERKITCDVSTGTRYMERHRDSQEWEKRVVDVPKAEP